MRRSRAFEDRAAVYVDSPLMTHRVRFKRQLFAPRSFFNVDDFLKTLASRPKAKLVEAIGRLIARAPEGLAALGVKGFEAEEPEELEAEGEDDAWR